ncbi:MAG: hypothetical protein GIW97_00425 [Candidatus Eremiobacteraeota bacterium]|nr:hypothetical protein [Candidatus Eremiobacteraeota bacterium]
MMIIFGASAGSAVIVKDSDGPAGAGLGLGTVLAPGDPLVFGAGEGVGEAVGVGDGVAEGDMLAFDRPFAPPDGDGTGVGRLKCRTQPNPPESGHAMPLARSAMRNACVSPGAPLARLLGATEPVAAGVAPKGPAPGD